MNDFPTPPIDNMGGLSAFEFFDAAEYNPAPGSSDLMITGPIIIESTIYKGVSDGSLKLTIEEIEDDENDTYYNINFEGAQPVSTPLAELFAKMKGRRLMILAKDSDNITYLCGTPDEPLAFKYKMDTGTHSSAKRYTYTFTGNQVNHPPIVEDAIPSPPSQSENSSAM